MVRKKQLKGLISEDIANFKNILLLKRKEILGDVISMESETLRRQRSDLSNLPIHLADAGSDIFEIENTLGLMDSERKILREVDAALSRIEEGKYGICEGNSELIPKQRLKAIPWTRYCVVCAGQMEKGVFRRSETSTFKEDYYDGDNGDDDLNQPYLKVYKP
jgi:RNA polymerase-binding transcription factor DksA